MAINVQALSKYGASLPTIDLRPPGMVQDGTEAGRNPNATAVDK